MEGRSNCRILRSLIDTAQELAVCVREGNGAIQSAFDDAPSSVLLVLQLGTFTFQLGDEQEQVSAGFWIFIPLGSVHGWRNSGIAEGQLLNIFTPAAGAVAFEEMRLQGKPIPDVDPSVRDKIFDRNGYEFVTWDW